MPPEKEGVRQGVKTRRQRESENTIIYIIPLLLSFLYGISFCCWVLDVERMWLLMLFM